MYGYKAIRPCWAEAGPARESPEQKKHWEFMKKASYENRIKNHIKIMNASYKKNTYNLVRDNALLTQTPQAFRYKDLYFLAKNYNKKIQDEATLFIQNDLKVKFIKGKNSNYKITYKEDIEHIVFLVHGFQGNSFDMRQIKNTYYWHFGYKNFPTLSQISCLKH